MVALAFLPPSMRKKTAKLYSGRLELRYAVQKRQLRSFHVDGHYNIALRLYDYAKHFFVEKAAVFISYDDKAKVRISVFYYFYVKIKAFI